MLLAPLSRERRFYFAVLTVLLVVAALYFPVLQADYVWDDTAFFTTASDLRTGDVWRAATASVIAGTTYFRPLVMLTMIAEARLLDANPLYSHLFNLVLHLLNILLVGLLARQLARSQNLDESRVPLAAVAMLLYGLHPALIEPAAWVSGRFDLMVTLFCLGALLLSARNAWWSDGLCALLFLAAALSKEMAATFGVLLFLWQWALQAPKSSLAARVRDTWQERKRLYLLIFVTGLIYVALRGHFMSQMVSFDPVMADQLGTFLRRGAYVGLTLDFYFRTVAFPFLQMGPLHPFDPLAMDGLQTAWGWMLIAVCLAWIIFSAWRATAAPLLLSAAFISLLPVLNFVPLTTVGNIGHERFLALPLVFFALSAALWLYRLQIPRRWRALAGGMTVLWLCAAAFNIHVTLPLWKNELVFWHWAYRVHPDSSYAQFSLATAAINAGRLDVLEEVMIKAEKKGVMPLRLTVPYAQYLARKGETQEGINKIRFALKDEIQPHLHVLQQGISLEDAQVGRGGFNPWFLVYAYDAMGQMHLSIRQFDAALESVNIARFYNKGTPRTLLTKSFALYGLGRFDEAEETYRTAESMYLPRIVPEARKLRLSFLTQLCNDGSARNNPTCTRMQIPPKDKPTS